MIVWETGTKDLLFRRRGTQFSFKLTYESQIDMFLIHDYPIQFDDGDLSWDGVETLLDHRILQKFDKELFVLRSELVDRPVVRRARLRRFERSSEGFGSFPLVGENTLVGRVHS